MRHYEFNAGEIADSTTRFLVVDLDAIVAVREAQRFDNNSGKFVPYWQVSFSNGPELLTKPAFDRILLAWRGE